MQFVRRHYLRKVWHWIDRAVFLLILMLLFAIGAGLLAYFGSSLRAGH